MDKGRALEYGRPAELLENDAGAFTGRLRSSPLLADCWQAQRRPVARLPGSHGSWILSTPYATHAFGDSAIPARRGQPPLEEYYTGFQIRGSTYEVAQNPNLMANSENIYLIFYGLVFL
jgi:hypothetical protein